MIEGYKDTQWGCLIVNSATEMALRDKVMQTENLLADHVSTCDFKNISEQRKNSSYS